MFPKQLRILIIEDESGNNQIFRYNLLHKMGLPEGHVTFCDNHHTAQEDFPTPEKDFDIILSDIHTHGGDGIDYARWLRADAASRGITPPAFVLHTTDTRTAERFLKGHPNCEEDLIDGLATKQDLFKPGTTFHTLKAGLANAQSRHATPGFTIDAGTAAGAQPQSAERAI